MNNSGLRFIPGMLVTAQAQRFLFLMKVFQSLRGLAEICRVEKKGHMKEMLSHFISGLQEGGRKKNTCHIHFPGWIFLKAMR